MLTLSSRSGTGETTLGEEVLLALVAAHNQGVRLELAPRRLPRIYRGPTQRRSKHAKRLRD